jgi:hypothetical protein
MKSNLKVCLTIMCLCAVRFSAALENEPVHVPKPTPWIAPSLNNFDLTSSKDSVYLKDRIQNNDKRFSSFILALQLMKERDAKVIVETGTARGGDQNFIGDGGATIIFGDWATRNDARVYSVDIDSNSIEAAKNAAKKYEENLTLVCSDSVDFLGSFSQPIDFLYLDCYDFDANEPLPSQLHHLNEIIAAYPCLHPGSIVLIDDCDLPHGGKGKAVIDFLIEQGWKVVFDGYQTMLITDEIAKK